MKGEPAKHAKGCQGARKSPKIPSDGTALIWLSQAAVLFSHSLQHSFLANI